MTVQQYEPPAEVATIDTDPTQPGHNLIAWANSLSAAHRIASALCQTAFVPKHFQGKPIEAAAALMLGEELGLAPVSALRSIYLIAGTPSLYAKAMVALVQSAGHEVWTEVDTPAKVVVCGRRRGSSHAEKSEWTTDRARRAGYTKNEKYTTDPQSMLYARAASDVCRKVAADVLAGVPYSVEEVELQAEDEKPKRTARRNLQPVEPTPEPDLAFEPDALITPDQQKLLHKLLNDTGRGDRDAGLAFCAEVVGHDVESTKTLTKAEASGIINRLTADVFTEPEPPLDESA